MENSPDSGSTTEEEDQFHDRVSAERRPVLELLQQHGTVDINTAVSYAAYLRILLAEERLASSMLLKTLRESVDNCDKLKAITEKLFEALDERRSDVVSNNVALEKLKTSVMMAHLSITPLAEKGEVWVKTQRNNGFRRFEDERKKHDQWRTWQAEDSRINPKVAEYSVIEQARRIKRKHNIPEAAETIAKKLAPKK